MSKPASTGTLNALHRKFAEYLESILDDATQPPAEGEPDHRIPLDAATMGCISKFLKDNDISAEPADKATLESLREKFSRNKNKTTSGIHNILADAESAVYDDQ